MRHHVPARLAVGRDFVLAEVSDYGFQSKIPWDTEIRSFPGPADGSFPAALPRRWFIARVG